MLKSRLQICILMSFLLLPSLRGASQEIVHALTGSVISIDTSKGTLALFEDSGNKGTFQLSPPKKRIAFDKMIAEDTVALNGSIKQGAYIILFYIGGEDSQAAVAIKDLGAGPFSSVTGEVAKWNGHDHSLVVIDKNGSEHSFAINQQSVAETPMGVVNGSKVNPAKGDHVRIVSSAKNGVSTVLFMSQK